MDFTLCIHTVPYASGILYNNLMCFNEAITLGYPMAGWLFLALPAVLSLWLISSRSHQRAMNHWGTFAHHANRLWWLERAWLCLILLGIIISLMKPSWGKEALNPTTIGKDLFLLIDVSQSMLAEDDPPDNRLARSRQAIDYLLLQLESQTLNTRLGIIVFAGNARILTPPTFDYQHVRYLLGNLSTESLGSLGRIQEQDDQALGTCFSSILPILEQWNSLHLTERANIQCLLISDGDDLQKWDDNPWKMCPYTIHCYAVG
ncbi:MAG TPA: VWA domain-containing protein, partial [Gemmatales bacterium]|nr:VWA domain-containing protein [Gemmatales bacterium]